MAVSLETRPPTPAPDQLRRLHARLAEQAAAATDVDGFFAPFLVEICRTLAVPGGAVWLAEAAGLRLVGQVGLEVAELARYESAVRAVLVEGTGRIAAAGGDESSAGSPSTGSPTDDASPEDAGSATATPAWMLYPIRLGTTTYGVVGLALAADMPRAARPALQRMLVPLCDHGAEFLYRLRTGSAVANSASQATVDSELAEYAQEIHASLDLRRTAAAVAHETSRLLKCDRVSALRYRHRRAEALAVSGQDYLDRRASLVRRLEALAAAVAATGETLNFPGDAEARAPQVESVLQAYLDEAHARQLTVAPLWTGGGSSEQGSQEQGEVVGVLVIERIAAGEAAEGKRRSKRSAPEAERSWQAPLAALLPHATSALANALRYDAVPLKFLSPAARVSGAFAGPRARSKTLLTAGGLAAALLAIWVIPYDFAVEARGTLQPVTRRDIFAPTDGTIDKIFVRHGDRVKPGDPLFELRSTELDVAEADLIKQINETEQEFTNAQRQYNDGRSLTAAEQSRLVGQIATLEQRRESLRRQAALFAEKRNRLRVAASLAGQVATWNVDELLAERPVRQGQTLTALVDPDGEWEIEIRVPEDRFGHVVEAQRGTKEPLEAVFVLAADPNREYRGKVVETHLAAEPRGEEGNVVLVRAAVDKRQIAQLHPGSDVRVRLECGTRSLGYVLLNDVWSFVQTRILFKL